MLSSFQAKDLRKADRITVQTSTGKHGGDVAVPPKQTPDVSGAVVLTLDCWECTITHSLSLPGYRLIAAERMP